MKKMPSKALCLVAILLLAGCSAARFDGPQGRVYPPSHPQGAQPQYLLPQPVQVGQWLYYYDNDYYAYPANPQFTEHLQAATETWHQAADQPPIPASIKMRSTKESSLPVLRMFLTALSAGVIPAFFWSDQEVTFFATLPDGEVASFTQQVHAKAVIGWLAPLFGYEWSGKEARASQVKIMYPLIAQQVQAEQQVLAQAGNDSRALVAALNNGSLKFYRTTAYKTLLAQAAASKNPSATYRQLVREVPLITSAMDEDLKLWYAGPSELVVKDLHDRLRTKRVTESSLIALVGQQSSGYSSLTEEQVAKLKQHGFGAALLEAMQAKPATEVPTHPVGITYAEYLKQKQAGGSNAQASLVAQHTAAPTVASAGTAQAGQQPPEKEGVVEGCAKAFAAIKLCENLPGDPFGISRSICVKQAKSKMGAEANSCFGL